ncbi:hypothetical protein RRG08_042445 [Elysia crispata]|uniref:Uncharacterized protein n=1 Tax=Elysia crispata TaxID=231223 RepID=A0AAE1DDP4_9GAST|nr:hypothetical protein RRG08_042445 [Elysia crispata]
MTDNLLVSSNNGCVHLTDYWVIAEWRSQNYNDGSLVAQARDVEEGKLQLKETQGMRASGFDQDSSINYSATPLPVFPMD